MLVKTSPMISDTTDGASSTSNSRGHCKCLERRWQFAMGMYWQPGSLSSGREMTNFTPFLAGRVQHGTLKFVWDFWSSSTQSPVRDSNWVLIAFTSEDVNTAARLFLVCILPASCLEEDRDTFQFAFNFLISFSYFLPHLIVFLLQIIQILFFCSMHFQLSFASSSVLSSHFSSSTPIFDSPPRSSKSKSSPNSSPLYFSSHSSPSPHWFSLRTSTRRFPPLLSVFLFLADRLNEVSMVRLFWIFNFSKFWIFLRETFFQRIENRSEFLLHLFKLTRKENRTSWSSRILAGANFVRAITSSKYPSIVFKTIVLFCILSICGF